MIVSSSTVHMTQSFSDGSTIFGDGAGDLHQFTGLLMQLDTYQPIVMLISQVIHLLLQRLELSKLLAQ
jgi:hypothetical protein